VYRYFGRRFPCEKGIGIENNLSTMSLGRISFVKAQRSALELFVPRAG
jgi:hypothetical protein